MTPALRPADRGGALIELIKEISPIGPLRLSASDGICMLRGILVNPQEGPLRLIVSSGLTVRYRSRLFVGHHRHDPRGTRIYPEQPMHKSVVSRTGSPSALGRGSSPDTRIAAGSSSGGRCLVAARGWYHQASPSVDAAAGRLAARRQAI